MPCGRFRTLRAAGVKKFSEYPLLGVAGRIFARGISKYDYRLPALTMSGAAASFRRGVLKRSAGVAPLKGAE